MISAWTIVAVPSEVYSFGWLCAIPYPFTALLLMISANYLFLPVYHQSGIDNCYLVSRMIISRTFSSNFNPRKFTVFGAEIQPNIAMYFKCGMDAARDVLYANCFILAISGIRRRFEPSIISNLTKCLFDFILFFDFPLSHWTQCSYGECNCMLLLCNLHNVGECLEMHTAHVEI